MNFNLLNIGRCMVSFYGSAECANASNFTGKSTGIASSEVLVFRSSFEPTLPPRFILCGDGPKEIFRSLKKNVI